MTNLETMITKSNEIKGILKNMGIELPDNVLIKVWNESAEIITCTDSSFHEKVFGGDVSVTGYMRHRSSDREILLNVGSTGSFDDLDIASTSKVWIQAAILKNWSAFKNVMCIYMDSEMAENKRIQLINETRIEKNLK